MSTTGTKLTINIRDLGLELEAGKSYRIDIDEGLTKEVGNNRSPSQPRPSFQVLDTLTNAIPTLLFPSYGSINISTTTYSISFDRTIIKGDTGNNFNLYRGENIGSAQLIKSLDIADSNISVISTNTLRLKFFGNLTRQSDYFITYDEGIVKDIFNIGAQPVVDESVWKFKTGNGPSVNSVHPVRGTTGSFITTATLTYTESINLVETNSNYYLYEKVGETSNLIYTFDANGSLVSTAGNNAIKIDLKGIVDGETTYFITADDGVVRSSYNYFESEPITDNSVFEYTTGSRPVITNTAPTKGSTNAGVSVIQWDYNRNTLPPSGNSKFYIYKDNNLYNSYKLGDSILQFSTTTNSVKLNLTSTNYQSFWEGGSTYHILADKGAIRDNNYFGSAAITSSTEFSFTTAPKPYVTSTTVIYSGTSIYTLLEYDRAVVKDYFVTADGLNWLEIRKEGGTMGTTPFFHYPGTGTYFGATKVSPKGFLINLTVRPAIKENITRGTYYYRSNYFASGDPDRMSQAPFAKITATTFTITGAIITSTNISFNEYLNTTTVTLNYDRTIGTTSTGNYYIYEGTTEPGSITTTLSPSNSRVTTSSNRVSINLVNLLQGEKTYWIRNDEGTFIDLFSITNEPVTDSSKIKFLTSSSKVVSTFPAYGISTKLPKTFKFEYSKSNLSTGSGQLSLIRASDDQIISTISSASGRVITTSSGITLDFPVNYEKSTTYYVTASQGVVIDRLGIPSLAITDNSVFQFTTDRGPVLVTATNITNQQEIIQVSMTATGTSGMPGAVFNPLIFTFDRPLSGNTSSVNYRFYKSTDTTLVSTIAATSTQIINSTQTSILLPNVEPFTKYYVNFDEGIVRDQILPTDALSSTSTCVIDVGNVFSQRVTLLGANANDRYGTSIAVQDTYLDDQKDQYFYMASTASVRQLYAYYNEAISQYGLFNLSIANASNIKKISVSPLQDVLIETETNLISLNSNNSQVFSIAKEYDRVGAIKNTTTANEYNLVSYVSTTSSVPVKLINSLGTATVLSLFSPEYHTNCEFGFDAEFYNNDLVIGAPGQNGTTTTSTGKIYYYNNILSTSTLTYSIESPNSTTYDRFGQSIDFDTDYIYVGAPNVGGIGKVYVFLKSNGSLVTTFENTSTTNFGRLVKVTRNHLVICDTNTWYLYKKSNWSFVLKRTEVNNFNLSTSFQTNQVVIGDPTWNGNRGRVDSYMINNLI